MGNISFIVKTGVLVVATMVMANASVNAAKYKLHGCSAEEKSRLLGEMARKTQEYFKDREDFVSGFAGATLVPYWSGERLIKWCDDAAAGKKVTINCEANYSNIDFDAIAAMFPPAVLNGDLEAYVKFKNEFMAKHGDQRHIFTQMKAVEHCRKLGVIE